MTDNGSLTESVAELWEELSTRGSIAGWPPAAAKSLEAVGAQRAAPLRTLADEAEQLGILPASLREACTLYVQGDYLQVRRKLQHLPDKADRAEQLGRLLKLLALLRVQQGQERIPVAALQRIWDEGRQLRHEDAELDELLEWLWHFCYRREDMPPEFWTHISEE